MPDETPFQTEADLRLRLKRFIRDTPGATDRDIALDFLDSVDDNEYEDLFVSYITGLVGGLSDFRIEARRLNTKAQHNEKREKRS